MSTDTSSDDAQAASGLFRDAPANAPEAPADAGTTTAAGADTAVIDAVDAPRASTETGAATGPAGGPVPPRTDADHDGSSEPAWRRTAIWWVPALVLLLVATAWVGFLMASRAGTALPGVTLEGVDVSGMDAAAIDTEMTGIVTARQTAVITATAADQTFTMQMGDEGYQADVDTAVDEALAAGRSGPVATVVNQVAATFGREWDLTLDTATIEAPVDEFIATVAAAIDTPPDEGSVQIDVDTATVVSTMPATGIELDQDQARSLVLEVAGTGQDTTVELPTTVMQPSTTDSTVQEATTAIEAILAEPYVLTSGDASITIEPTEFAGFLAVAGPDESFAVTLQQEPLRTAMEGRGDQFNVEPVSAQYVIQSGWRTYDNKGSGTFDPSPASIDIVDGSTGLAYDADAATQQIVDLYDAGEHAGELTLEVVEPELSNERAVELAPNALLGTFTTYEACCDNRQHNIRRITDLIDGAMLLPGENYSVNDTIGPRTLENGFLPAGAIINGEINEDDIGGGISQTATTFYNAAFFAGIEILEHTPHSWPISRYPMGREATFSYAGDLDINILNNTSHAIIVSSSWEGESVTYSIFGYDDGREVTAEMGEPSDYQDPPEAERRATDELYVGNERQVQGPDRGFTIDFKRIIEGGETPGTENLSWTYSPKQEIIEYGTRPLTEPPYVPPPDDDE